MDRMKIVDALNPATAGTEVTLAGWVRTARELDCAMLMDEFYSHFKYKYKYFVLEQ